MSIGRRESSTPALLPPRVQQRRPLAQPLSDQYKGYLPRDGDLPATESIEALDRERLWQEYISYRKPVVIDGLIQEEGWQSDAWKDLSFLRKVAGSTLVKIEPVDATKDQFGTSAKRKTVLLSHFLDMLEDPTMAGKWYLTTQYDEEEEEEEELDRDDDTQAETDSLPISKDKSAGIRIDERLLPALHMDVSLPPPTESLAHLFPLPGPEIMGSLVLQQCNLWMGNGTSGKSSGLHHDFHDNLYMLLSGRKRFLIWPPLAHRWLEPVGKVEAVHPNGLIEYGMPGQMPLQADGLTRRESASWLLRARLRALLEADERAACQTGEEHVIKAMRKGKGKQTAEQEMALLKLREAEVEILLLQMDDEEDDEGSDALSTMSSENSFSDLFDRDLVSSDLDEDTSDEKMRVSDDYQESLLSDASDIVDNDSKKVKKSNGKRTQSVEDDTQENCLVKKQRRTSSKLIIPKGNLPGGLRGSLQDLEGDLDSGSDEYADEDEETTDVYFEPIEGEQQTEEEVMMMTLAARTRVLSRMRAMENGQFGGSGEGEEDDEEGDEDFTDDEEAGDSDEEAGNTNGAPKRIKRGASSGGETDSQSSADSEGSWPDVDVDALEEGEAALEELARLQSQHEGTSHTIEGIDGEDDPKSFSKISPKVMQWYFGKAFDPATNQAPELEATSDNQVHLVPRVGCPPPMEIHLQAGQMLYLPASWYHEVTSYSDPKEKSGVHMALNYWFHPPTAIRRPGQAPVQTRGGSKVKSAFADSSQPYLNAEVWDEIRRSVKSKVDTIRRRAAKQQQHQEQQQS